MKVMARALAFVLLPAAQASDATPIGKVLLLLSDLQAKITGEGE
eukprot:CAMPEP_0179084490 /NCGR_PEP_ID=MMETSP0796-20121207/38213_1 /TAXON_ID=73915 /ORGANISM="Pyrodinium bahamense, Strain pbaha01" /LENGTH=43 /DNA_ID= /DNA_START= /DNA_END= /DNA_ORIENTATION=